MRIKELRERNKTKIHCPKEWTKAYKKGTKNTNRTYIEEMQARAVEIIVNAGGITPLWIGVIPKAWMWLMKWNIEEYQIIIFLSTYGKLEESYIPLRESHGR
jgi:hypothetical protein